MSTAQRTSGRPGVGVLTAWQASSLAQGCFDWALPRFEWQVTKQVAESLTVGRDSVIRLIEDGSLEARRINIQGARGDYRISRRSILHYMASTWELPPAEFAQRAVDFVEAIKDVRTLELVVAAGQRELERRRK